jgi:hypothetical protein
MVRARVGLLAAGALMMLAGACGTEPAATPPAAGPGGGLPPAPTAPVGADGQPITNLCELLTDKDVSSVLGVEAKAPAANDATATSATCAYGDSMTLTVTVLPSADAASSTLREAVQNGKFTTKKDGVQAGVDESVYGTTKESFGLTLRRKNLVVTILVPTAPVEGEAKVAQLAGIVLSRANALGT